MLSDDELKRMHAAVRRARQLGASGDTVHVLEHSVSEELRSIAESSYHAYVRQAWHIVEPSVQFIDGWHLHAICEHLEAVAAGQIENLIINQPPGTMKSLAASVFFCPWVWTNRPSERFLYASYDQALSTRDSIRSRSIIQSEWYQRLWGEAFDLVGDQNQKIRFDNDQRGWRIATSVGGRGTGEHPTILIGDDVHNTKRAESQADRDAIKEWWRSVVVSRGKIADVRRVIVMQRVHQDDICQYLLDTDAESWEVLCLPMRYEAGRMKSTSLGFTDPRTEEGELLWDPPFTERKVTSLEREMGSLTAAGQLQQRPAPAGGNILKREWYEVVDNPHVDDTYSPVRYWDLAGSTSKQADFTAGVKMCMLKDGSVLIDDVVHGKWSAYDRDKVIRQTAEIDGRDTIVFVEQEPGASGLTVARHYINLLRGYACYSDRPGTNKIARATPFASYSEAGMVKLRRATWNTVLIDEFEVFPNGKHDDIVDATSGAFTKLVGDGVDNTFDGDMLASGEDPYEESRPFTPEEKEELPDWLRDFVDSGSGGMYDREDEDENWNPDARF